MLVNRLGRNVPMKVPPALLKAGLDAASIPTFIAAVSVNPSGNFSTVAGLTPSIAKAGLRAYQEASLSAYGTVWFTTIALSVLSMIFTIWAPNVNHLLTSDVNAPIHQRNSETLPDGKGSQEVVEQV